MHSYTANTQNIVLNGSFEDWQQDSCLYVSAYCPSVDVFKNRVRILPKQSYSPASYKRQPRRASKGFSYCGLDSWVNASEAIILELDSTLLTGEKYILLFDIYKDPRMDTSFHFPYKFLAQKLHKDKEHGYSGENHYFITDDSTSQQGWQTITDTVQMSRDYRYLMIIAPISKDIKDSYYYYYDNIRLFSTNNLKFSIFFGYNESAPQNLHLENFKEWLSKIDQSQIKRFKLMGYADKPGNNQYNYELSKRRVENVASIILESTSSIEIGKEYFGDLKASSSSKDSIFRRVDVSIDLSTYKKYISEIPDRIVHSIIDAYKSDQKVRNPLANYSQEEMVNIDKENLKLIEEILPKYNYIGHSEIGFEHKDDLAVLILHQELETLIKYTPIVERAADNGECSISLIPYFIDKIKVGQKQPQIFGTQLYFSQDERMYKPYPISHISTLDERRREYSLNEFDKYLKSCNEEFEEK